VKIICPLSDVYEVTPLIAAGADEFYCGVLPSYWRDHYGEFGLLNRREGLNSQFTSVESLKETVRQAHNSRTPVYIALNGLYFLNHQYELLERLLKDITGANADGVIVTEIGLLGLLQDLGYEGDIHISCGCNVFNGESIEFFKNFGANRIILPRDFTKRELAALSGHDSGVELEAFVLNTKCRQVDGLCNWYHGFLKEARVLEEPDRHIVMSTYDANCRPHMCGRNFEFTAFSGSSKPQGTKGSHIIKSFDKPCGACDIYDFAALGIKHLKIVERSAPLMYKEKDVKFIKACIQLVPKLSKAEYVAEAKKLYAKYYEKQCSKINCYYPS